MAALKWGFKIMKTLKNVMKASGLGTDSDSENTATAGAKPTKVASTATETASIEGLQEKAKDMLIQQASDPSASVAEFQELIGDKPSSAEYVADAGTAVSEQEELNKTVPSDANTKPVSQQIAEMREHVKGQETAGIGHNRPPEGTEIFNEEGSVVLSVLNENYRPGSMTYDELSQNIVTIRSEATAFKRDSQNFRDHLAGLAADYMILRRNGAGTLVFNGAVTPVTKLVMENTPVSIEQGRKELLAFLNNVCNYKPQMALVVDNGKKGTPDISLPDANNGEIASVATAITEAVKAGILVYFGKFGFTMAEFVPSGTRVVSDELRAEFAARGEEIKSVRRLAFQWNLFSPFYLVQGEDMPSTSRLIVATSTTTKLAFDVLTGKAYLDKYGKKTAIAGRATGGVTKPEETAEQKKEREAEEAKAGSEKLVKAAEVMSGLAGKPGSTEPGKEGEAIPADKVAISKVLLGSVVTATREVFSKTHPETHDMELARHLLEAATVLVQRVQWTADRVKKDIKFMEAAANLNMELVEVMDDDATNKTALA